MANFRLLLVILETNSIKYTKSIRFRRLFWHIVRFCISIGLKVRAQNRNFPNFAFLQFCKKNSWRFCFSQMSIFKANFWAFYQQIAKSLSNFLAWNAYFEAFQVLVSFLVQKLWLEDQTVWNLCFHNFVKKLLSNCLIILKAKVHISNQNGLNSLLRYWCDGIITYL